MALRFNGIFVLLLLAATNLARCTELPSCDGTCQRPQTNVRPQNLLVKEEESIVDLRCFTACSGEDASQTYNRTQLSCCVRGCLMQYRDPALSTDSCRSACLNDSSCLTGCSIYAKYIRQQGLSENPGCTFVSEVGNLSTTERVYISREAECLVYNCEITPSGPDAQSFPVNCSILHRTLKSCVPSLTKEQIRFANCCGFCSVPETPDRALILSPLENSTMNSQYRVAIPEQTNANESRSTVGYLLKIEDCVENVTAYFSMRTPVSSISLLPFTCNEVSVSYAAVNKFGASNYSQATDILVYEPAELPQFPIIQSLSFEEDLRVGFLRHANVTVVWELPKGYGSVCYYEVTLENIDTRTVCNQQVKHSMRVNKDQTNFTIVAKNTSKTSPPLFDCKYNLMVSSHPGSANTTMFQVKHSGKKLNIESKCESTFDSVTASYNFTATFTVPKLISVAIHNFHPIFSRIKSEDAPIIGGRTDNPIVNKIKENENETKYEVKISNSSIIRETEGLYKLLIWIVSPRKRFFWRGPLIPGSMQCTWKTPPVKPTTMQTIIATNLTFTEANNLVEFMVTWYPPMYPNGDLELFQLRVGMEEIAPGDNEILNSHSFRRNNIQPDQMEFRVRVVFQFTSTPENERILHLQMRSRNQYLFSNWSQPVLLNISEGIVVTSANPTGVPASDGGLPVFAYVLFGVTGVVLLVALVIPITVCCHRSCFHRRIKLDKLIPAFDPMMAANRRPSPVLVPILSDEWEIPRDELKVFDKEPLGKGCFGEVHKGILAGQTTKRSVLGTTRSSRFSLACTVAVKKLKKNTTSSIKANFLKEIEMMKKVSGTGNELSKFVVNMVGCCTMQEPLLLVLEYIKHGDLLIYLRSMRQKGNAENHQDAVPYLEPNGVYSKLDPKDDPYRELGVLEEKDLLEFARQIAAGMEFLAGLDIVHRDLACRNILIGEKKHLKISDFGMSRLVPADEVYVPTSHGLLPLRWMAAESIFHREFTIASDSWSYGVVLWEICTLGGFPYPSLSNSELASFLKRGYRMEKPDTCSPEVYEIMLHCWNEDPEERPTFEELHKTFDQFLSNHIQDRYPYIELQTTLPYSFDKLEPITCLAKTPPNDECPIDLDTSDPDTDTTAIFDIKIVPTGQQLSLESTNSHILQVPAGSRLSTVSAQLRNSNPDIQMREMEVDRISFISAGIPETRYVESPVGISRTSTLLAPDLSIQDELLEHLERKLSSIGGNFPHNDHSGSDKSLNHCSHSFGSEQSEPSPSSPPKILAISVPEVTFNGSPLACDQDDTDKQLGLLFRETDL